MTNASLSEDSTAGMLHEGVTKLEVSSITMAEGSMVPVDVHHRTVAGTPAHAKGNMCMHTRCGDIMYYFLHMRSSNI